MSRHLFVTPLSPMDLKHPANKNTADNEIINMNEYRDFTMSKMNSPVVREISKNLANCQGRFKMNLRKTCTIMPHPIEKPVGLGHGA